jgi:hypothetical protein
VELTPILIVGIIFGGGWLALIVGTIAEAVRKSIVACARERSRRELAAYVAEGTMSPEQALRMLEAGEPNLPKLAARAA